MILFFFMLSTVNAMTMLDATLGVIGRGVDPIPDAQAAYRALEDENWKLAEEKWKERTLNRDAWAKYATIWQVICLVKQNRASDATSVLQNGIKTSDWNKVLTQAWILGEIGAEDQAQEILSSFPNQHIDHIGAEIFRLRAMTSMGQMDMAEQLREKIVEKGIVDAWFWMENGIANAWNRKPAMHYFERAVEAENAAPVHYQSLITQTLLSKKQDLFFRYSLEGMNRFPEAVKLEQAVVGAIIHEKLLEKLLEFAQKAPERSDVQALLGIVLGIQNKSGAEAHLRKARSGGIRSPSVYLLLAISLLKDGQQNQAWNILKEGALANPQNVELWTQFFLISLKKDKVNLLLEALENSWSINGKLPEEITSMAIDAASSVKNLDRAMAWAERNVEIQHNSLGSIVQRASIFSLRGEWEEAIKDYEKALILQPENSEAMLDLAKLLLSQKKVSQHSRALKLAETAIKITGSPDADHYQVLASALWKLHRKREAIDVQERAVLLYPEDEQIRIQLERYKTEKSP